MCYVFLLIKLNWFFLLLYLFLLNIRKELQNKMVKRHNYNYHITILSFIACSSEKILLYGLSGNHDGLGLILNLKHFLFTFPRTCQ